MRVSTRTFSPTFTKSGTCTTSPVSKVAGFEPPPHVDLEVAQTDPGLKGDTATGGNKPATLETGVTVQVPLFVNVGDRVRVDTRSNEYLTRV